MSLLDLRRARPPLGLVRGLPKPRWHRGEGWSGQAVAVDDLAGRAVGQHAAVEVDLDLAAFELAANELLRQRILHVALDRATKRSGAVGPIPAGDVDDPVADVRPLESAGGQSAEH